MRAKVGVGRRFKPSIFRAQCWSWVGKCWSRQRTSETGITYSSIFSTTLHVRPHSISASSTAGCRCRYGQFRRSMVSRAVRDELRVSYGGLLAMQQLAQYGIIALVVAVITEWTTKHTATGVGAN